MLIPFIPIPGLIKKQRKFIEIKFKIIYNYLKSIDSCPKLNFDKNKNTILSENYFKSFRFHTDYSKLKKAYRKINNDLKHFSINAGGRFSVLKIKTKFKNIGIKRKYVYKISEMHKFPIDLELLINSFDQQFDKSYLIKYCETLKSVLVRKI